MRKKKLIIFDLDGTLVNSRRDIANSVNFCLEKFGRLPMPEEKITAFIGDGTGRLISRVLGTSQRRPVRKFLELFYPHYLQHCLDNTNFYPGIKKILPALAKKFFLAVVTNKYQEFTEKILTGLGVRKYFSLIVGGDKTLNRKPHPEAIYYCLKRLSIGPQDTVVVGDSPNDILAAKASACWSVAVGWGFAPIDFLRKFSPDAVATKPAELKRLFFLLCA